MLNDLDDDDDDRLDAVSRRFGSFAMPAVGGSELSSRASALRARAASDSDDGGEMAAVKRILQEV